MTLALRSAAVPVLSRIRRARTRALPMLAALALPLPVGWPHHLALGVADAPGDAAAIHATAPFDLRYQYLAGGVNTGHGWLTWDPNGSFVSDYARESVRAHMITVFTYYQILDSAPSLGASEQARDISDLRNPATMRAYWSDFALLMRRIHQSDGGHLVVVHLEPDLWGYLEQADDVTLARGIAAHFLALRNELAPEVKLAWHLSVWGTGEDPTYSKPSLAHMDVLAARSAAFFESLHAHFDLVFNDVTDRDAGYYQVVEHNPATWWTAADFARHTRYIAGFTRRTHVPVVLWRAAARQHDARRHVGPLPRQPRPVVARRSDRRPPARRARGRRHRAAVRRRRHGHDLAADRRRALLSPVRRLPRPPARAALSGVSAGGRRSASGARA